MVKYTSSGRKILSELNKLNKNKIYVGFTGDDVYDDGQTVAEVAFKNEFGDNKTPPRPFMRQTIVENQEEIKSFISDVASAIIQGKETAISGANLIGEYGVEAMKYTIEHGMFKPNSPMTIAIKGSNKPLVDSGKMRDSVKYVIKE